MSPTHAIAAGGYLCALSKINTPHALVVIERFSSMQADMNRIARGLLPIPKATTLRGRVTRENATAADVERYRAAMWATCGIRRTA